MPTVAPSFRVYFRDSGAPLHWNSHTAASAFASEAETGRGSKRPDVGTEALPSRFGAKAEDCESRKGPPASRLGPAGGPDGGASLANSQKSRGQREPKGAPWDPFWDPFWARFLAKTPKQEPDLG